MREFHRKTRQSFARFSTKLSQEKNPIVPELATKVPETFELSAGATGNQGETMSEGWRNINFRLDQGRN